jgi:hypothetical protein
VVTLVEQLDRYLPPGPCFHLFGVKGAALKHLGGHPRVASIDSMAWDSAARIDMPTGRTMEYRLRVMENWLARNVAQKGRHRLLSPPPRLRAQPVECFPGEEDDEVAAWMDLVERGEIEYASALAHMERRWVGALVAHNHALDDPATVEKD